MSQLSGIAFSEAAQKLLNM